MHTPTTPTIPPRGWTVVHQKLVTLMKGAEIPKWQLARYLGLAERRLREWLPDPDGRKIPAGIDPLKIDQINAVHYIDAQPKERMVMLRENEIAVVMARARPAPRAERQAGS